jgi:DNA-binding GntR family transcriptional regulator
VSQPARRSAAPSQAPSRAPLEAPSGLPSPHYSGPVPRPLATLNRLTLREQVLEQLRSEITSGRLLPGTDLIETELADGYSVSRGTVREALRFLQQARLVAGDSRGKLRVHTASHKEIAEIFNVRASLEGMAVRDIIASATRETAAQTLRAALPPESLHDDFTTHMNLDLRFHEQICELSGNTTLLELWRGLEDRMRIVFFSAREAEPVPIMSKAHHEPIVRCIEEGDVHQAQATLLRHMNAASRRWAPDVPVADAD